MLATPRTVATTTKEGAIVRCGNITRKELGQILVGVNNPCRGLRIRPAGLKPSPCTSGYPLNLVQGCIFCVWRMQTWVVQIHSFSESLQLLRGIYGQYHLLGHVCPTILRVVPIVENALCYGNAKLSRGPKH